jgi:hypothetical protein
MLSRRTLHGIGWGMVSAPVVALIPLADLAFNLTPAPAPLTPSLFGRVLGSDPTGLPAMALAVLWQIIYSGFWGGFLAYVSGPLRADEQPLVRPSMTTYGLGVGLYRFGVANLTALLYVGWGPFAVLVSPLAILPVLLSDVGFGLVLSWLIAREDTGRLEFRIPRALAAGRGARH